jgi:rhodanese-related sulfurtransferase
MNNIPFKLRSFVFLCCMLLASVSYAEKSKYQSPEYVEGAITTSLLDAKKLFDQGVVFIDVRNLRYYARAHIPNAFHMDFKYDFDESKLDGVATKAQPIVIYCSGVTCSRSYRASVKVLSWGFTKVHYFRGGFAEWKKAGFEITTKPKNPGER